jgi:hypothetical protein
VRHASNRATSRRRSIIGVLAVSLTAASALVVVSGPVTVEAQVAGVADSDWLGIVNVYREQSGLGAVTSNPWWSAGAVNHSCWMLLNGIAHDEQPGTPGYTTSGDEAGNNGNVAVSTNSLATARSHIDLWMSGPFHAIGLLRSSLRQAGFGICSSPPNPSTTAWKSGATLDVLRGNDWSAPKPAEPVVFPGNGATTSLTRFVAESPDPRTFCGWGGRNVGLPLIALMPSRVTSAVASLSGPNGPVPTCVLHTANTTGVASSILGGDHAVVVVPNAPLTTGKYTASVGSNGGNATWTFHVDPNAALAPAGPDPAATTSLAAAAGFRSITPFRFADSRSALGVTRLQAGRPTRVKVAGQRGLPTDITAVSANFTVVGPDGRGFLTAYNCSATRPTVSTLNYQPYDVVPNQAVIPLDRGDLCLYSMRNADVVIDVNGYVSPSATQRFVPVDPYRVIDTRLTQRLTKGSRLTLSVEGGNSPAPASATAVALNLTGVSPHKDGWIRAFPCDAPEPEVSSLNPRSGQNRANSAVVSTAADGTICLTTNVTTDIVVDITGWFSDGNGHRFVPLLPMRMADTRSLHPALNPSRDGQPLAAGKVLRIPIAGVRGVPSSARAATINLVSVGAVGRGWLRVVPCGAGSEVSNLNYSSGSAIANGANVKLDANGAVCVLTNQTTHVVLDVTGVWT